MYKPLSDEELSYLENEASKKEINEALDRVISDMDDYCEYLIRMQEKKKRIRKCNWFLLIHIEFFDCRAISKYHTFILEQTY